MKARSRRMILIGLVLGGVTVSAVLATQAFRENLLYFFSPTQVVAGEAPTERAFRLGGIVVEDSVRREPGSITVEFDVTDYGQTVPVRHSGVLPDLFQEGQGVVVRGRYDASGVFEADEVLARHDENYMPPEVADALAQREEAQQ